MLLKGRLLLERDLGECLALDPTHAGHELVGWDAAVNAWKLLMSSQSFASCVVEMDHPGPGQIAGFGASVFVSPAFAREELGNPHPGLIARIMEGVHCGRSLVLTDAERRAGNTRGDLAIVVLAAAWRDDLTADQVREVQFLQTKAFAEFHTGFRIERLLFEVTTAKNRTYAESIPGWEILSNFEEHYRKEHDTRWSPGRGLAVMERDRARSIPGTVGAALFHTRQTRLHLREPEQRLLASALGGLTDDEAAQQLGWQKPTVKKHWAAIFERVREAMPDLISATGPGGKRGQQKRHRLMAYLREHPEELKPVEASAGPRKREQSAGA